MRCSARPTACSPPARSRSALSKTGRALARILLAVACAAPAAGNGAAFAGALIDPALRACPPVARAMSAEPDARVAAPLPSAVSYENGAGWADVWLLGAVDPDRIRALGGEVHTVAGAVMTARVPLAALAALEQVAGLERAQLAEPVTFQSDVSTHEIGADQLWGGPPPSYSPTGVTGKRVVIGIVDTGIDPKHPDFRTASGTRIKWLWDQNFGYTAPPPSGYSYGSEYSQAAINSGQWGGGDVNGHGTHMAGVAAGNGRGTGNGKPAYTYLGAAPEADLVVVSLRYASDGSVTDDKVLDAVRYVFQKAAALGEPAVVLLSVSKCTGPHDGRDPLDLGITALTGPGKLVCAAAGNYGGKSRHAEWTSVSSGQTGTLTFSIPAYTPSGVAADAVQIEGWYDASANYSVSIVTPGGQTIGPVARGGTTTVNSASGIVKIGNGDYTSANGAYRVSLYVYRGSITYPQLAAGTWTIRMTSAASGSHRLDAWLTAYMLGGTLPAFVAGMSETRLVGSPATADGVLAVGAYSTKRTWTAVDGKSYSYSLAALHDLASYSSPGPRRDGQRVPQVAAPGYGVSSSRSTQWYPSTMYFMPDSAHAIQNGTSVAAAGAAGVLAMLLQSNATLTPAAAVTQITQRALADSYTGAVPNDRWGWGKLRAVASTTGVGDPDGPQVRFALRSANPVRGPVSFALSLAPEDIASGQPARIAIVDVNGRRVATLRAEPVPGPQTLTWDGRRADGERAVPGVYWARLQAGPQESTLKFVRL
jgi:subtilisin family serine protease